MRHEQSSTGEAPPLPPVDARTAVELAPHDRHPTGETKGLLLDILNFQKYDLHPSSHPLLFEPPVAAGGFFYFLFG
jgi:hypothetical protein